MKFLNSLKNEKKKINNKNYVKENLMGKEGI